MSASERPDDPSAPAPGPAPESIFAKHVDGLEPGAELDLEELCLEHPEQADELRRIHEHWTQLTGVLSALDGGKSFARRLRSRYGKEADPAITLEPQDDDPGVTPASGVLRRLSARLPKESRYRVLEEVARGGMGAILKVWDEDLRRTLAMKVLLSRPDEKDGSTGASHTRTLGRFLEESQVTAQLDHPGIVPVHELGIDSSGRVFFTMKLVRGRDLGQVFELVKKREEGWTRARAVGVILRLCEAMAYAHSKKVIHRDLKPSNVMVGRFGEVYAMDWGLARVLGRADKRDLRLREGLKSGDSVEISMVETDRGAARHSTPDSPLVTMDGDVVGTPAYMSPEQARGELDTMGPSSDVYSIGAILYHLLAGHMPYVPTGEKRNAMAVWGLVQAGKLEPLSEEAKDAPAELVAICEKAMAREAKDRYQDTLEMAEDLRAYSEGHVVGAYEQGAVAEFRKWVGRNRALAATVAASIVFLLGGSLTAAAVLKNKSDEAEQARDDAIAANQEINLLVEELQVEQEQSEERRLLADQARERAEVQTYIANVTAASVGLENGEYVEARRRLDACPETLRGWEWRHLDLQQRLQEDASSGAFFGHTDAVTDVAVTAGGGRMVSASRDKTLRVWNLDTREILSVLTGHERTVNTVAVTPDRRWIVSGSSDRTVRIWDGVSAKEVRRFEMDRKLLDVAVSADGKLVLIGTNDHEARMIDAETGADRMVFEGHDQGIHSVVFSPDEQRVATGSFDFTARIWDVTTGKALTPPMEHDDVVLSVAFSPDGTRLATGSRGGIVRLWHAGSGDPIGVLEGPKSAVTSVAFGADGDRLVAGSRDKTVRVWDLERWIGLAILRGHGEQVTSVAVDPESGRVVSASHDKSLRTWDAETSGATLVLTGDPNLWGEDANSALVVAPAGNRFYTASTEGALREWNLETGEALRFLRAHEGGIRDLAISEDGSWLVTGGDDRKARLWDAAELEEIRTFEDHGFAVTSVAVSSALGRVVTACRDKRVRVFDAKSGELLQEIEGHNMAVTCLALDPEKERIASGSLDRSIRIWDLESGEELGLLEGHDNFVRCLAFAPGGERLISGSRDRTVRTWDVDEGRCVYVLEGHDGEVLSLTPTPDGSRIVSGSEDATAWVWDAERGLAVVRIRGRGSVWGREMIRAVGVSPDGQRVITTGWDEKVTLWESVEEQAQRMRQGAARTRMIRGIIDRLTEEVRRPDQVITRLVELDSLTPDLLEEAMKRVRGQSVPDEDEIVDEIRLILKREQPSEQEFDRALRWAEFGLEREPDDLALFVTLGMVHFEREEFHTAIEVLSQVGERAGNSEDPAVLRERVRANCYHTMALLRLDREEEALDVFREAGQIWDEAREDPELESIIRAIGVELSRR